MVMTFLAAAVLATAPLSAELSDAERKAMLDGLSKQELQAVIEQTPPKILIDLGLKAVNALGTYRYVMKKTERIRGEVRPEQEVRVFIREKPSAIRLEYFAGPAAGRTVLYNAKVDQKRLRVREGGILGVVGGLWVGVDSPMTRDDSNHAVTEAGVGSLLRRLSTDQARAGAALTIKHEGWRGELFCSLFSLPKDQGFDHAKTRVCYDPKAGVPMLVEGFDASGGLVERYAFSDFKAFTPSETTFDPDKGL